VGSKGKGRSVASYCNGRIYSWQRCPPRTAHIPPTSTARSMYSYSFLLTKDISAATLYSMAPSATAEEVPVSLESRTLSSKPATVTASVLHGALDLRLVRFPRKHMRVAQMSYLSYRKPEVSNNPLQASFKSRSSPPASAGRM